LSSHSSLYTLNLSLYPGPNMPTKLDSGSLLTGRQRSISPNNTNPRFLHHATIATPTIASRRTALITLVFRRAHPGLADGAVSGQTRLNNGSINFPRTSGELAHHYKSDSRQCVRSKRIRIPHWRWSWSWLWVSRSDSQRTKHTTKSTELHSSATRGMASSLRRLLAFGTLVYVSGDFDIGLLCKAAIGVPAYRPVEQRAALHGPALRV